MLHQPTYINKLHGQPHTQGCCVGNDVHDSATSYMVAAFVQLFDNSV